MASNCSLFCILCLHSCSTFCVTSNNNFFLAALLHQAPCLSPFVTIPFTLFLSSVIQKLACFRVLHLHSHFTPIVTVILWANEWWWWSWYRQIHLSSVLIVWFLCWFIYFFHNFSKWQIILVLLLFELKFLSCNHRHSQMALGAVAPRVPRLAKRQKPNRIEERELNDICSHWTCFLGS